MVNQGSSTSSTSQTRAAILFGLAAILLKFLFYRMIVIKFIPLILMNFSVFFFTAGGIYLSLFIYLIRNLRRYILAMCLS
ncbi:hypothetical protein CS542_05720 [Pedobacter sp. IW39]|nr:hypothetical protein CS542_05720 [Pedobacter sp. IW39]